MEEFFYCCKHLPDIDSFYVNQGLQGQYNVHYSPHFFWATSTFLVTDFFSNLKKALGNITVNYVKSPSNSYYRWHVDDPTTRKCSINFPLVASNDAHVFYRTHVDSTYYTLHEVEYVMYKPTVLNIEKEHCIINNSNTERIVLNLGVLDASYADTVEYLKQLRIDKY